MATRCRTTRSFGWHVIGSAWRRRGPSYRATCLSLAGLLAVSALAGCGGGSKWPVVAPLVSGQPAAPTTTTQPGGTAAGPIATTQPGEPPTAPATTTQPGETAAAPAATLAHGPTGFSATGSMATARFAHTATLLADGRVLIAGGLSADFRVSASAELYDPASGSFSATGSMTQACAYATATLLSDGRVLIVGGLDDKGDSLA